MNEIIEALQKLKANCGNAQGLDDCYLENAVDHILDLCKAELPEPGESNSQRVRRLIAAGNYSI